MGTHSSSCPGCSAAISADDKFCGACGALLGQTPPPKASPAKSTMLGMSPTSAGATSSPQAAPDPRKATMLGMSATTAKAPPPTSGEAGSSDPALQKTMLGMQSPFASAAPPAAGKAPPAAAPGAAAGGAGGGSPDGGGQGDLNRTVFGVSPDVAGGAKKTMLGMVSPVAGGGPGPELQASPSPSRAPDPNPHAGAASSKGRTMLGMMTPLAGGGATAQPGAASAGAAGDPKTNRTMLGMSQPSASGAPPAAGDPARSDTPRAEPPSFSQPHAEVHDDGGRSHSEAELQARLSGSGRGREGASKGLWGVFAVLALLLSAVALSFVFLRGSPEVEVAVVAGAQGDTLQVHVPQAASGTKVRYAGLEVPAEAGRAVFPLAADALKVGDNVVSLEIVEPGEDVSTTELALHVDYRVRMDVSGLARPQPEVAVIVDAIRGTKVSVAGAPVELDESGSARVPFPVGDTAGARFDLEVPYHVAPPKGPAVDGKLELHLPVASMQIDRPGEEVFTDSAQVEIGGAVEPGAKVEVDGTPVPVSDGRFLHSQALGKSGEYTFSVVARVEGKAPRARTVKVTRVEDMAIAAAAFEYDGDLSYARIAQNPTIYRGQRAGFDGRVYHVEVQGGRSVLQMLVRDCPRGHKCQLWVDYAQATDATVGSLVRVLGVVSGEQQYRSKKGGVQTAPAVSARFILPLVK